MHVHTGWKESKSTLIIPQSKMATNKKNTNQLKLKPKLSLSFSLNGDIPLTTSLEYLKNSFKEAFPSPTPRPHPSHPIPAF